MAEDKLRPDPEPFLVETTVLGGFARVAAIDPATGLEALAAGPAACAAELERIAVGKLERLLQAQRAFGRRAAPAIAPRGGQRRGLSI